MQESLKYVTVRALKWTFLETVASRGLQFIVGVILARLLFPEQFGLIAMLAIFIAIAQCFLDSGFAAAGFAAAAPTAGAATAGVRLEARVDWSSPGIGVGSGGVKTFG